MQSTKMDWGKLLSEELLGNPHFQSFPERSVFVQDYDRIVFSAPFRRLANKTQVQPLYENDHVHHRLIHSIEVSNVGRSLAMQVGHRLVELNEIAMPQVRHLVDSVQAACVAHDIGNPPFGHSGEQAMGDWFAEYIQERRGLVPQLAPSLYDEFTAFEGNAQGFRILTRLEMYRNQGGMRLSKATLGAFTKYPVTAADKAATASAPAYVGRKKFGIFQTDLPQFEDVAETLGLIAVEHNGARFWRRHPLVFLMEAADDITYNIVDMEDAFTTGELSFDVVHDLLSAVADLDLRKDSSKLESEKIAILRAMSIGKAIYACVNAFMDNYAEIMSGTFSDSLIEKSRLAAPFAAIEHMAHDRIFTAPRKTELEISGRQIIRNVMSGILPVYEELAEDKCGWDKDKLSGHAKQLVRALDLDLRDVKDAESALHALADFTSGMTDRYALRISRMLSGT